MQTSIFQSTVNLTITKRTILQMQIEGQCSVQSRNQDMQELNDMRMRISTGAKVAAICSYRLKAIKNLSIRKDLVWKEDLMTMQELKRGITMRALAQTMMLNRRVGRLHNSYHHRPMSLEAILLDNRSLQYLSNVVMFSRKVTKTCRLKQLAPCIKGWQSRVPIKTIRIKSHNLTSQVSSVHRLKTTRILNLRQLSTQLKALSAFHQWASNSYQIVNSSVASQQLQIKLYPIVKVSQTLFKTHLKEAKKGY